MPISAFSPKSGHTSRYIRKQITIDISRGIPSFERPIIGTQIVTHLGISHLFVTLRSANHWGHVLRHLHFLPIFSWHTYNDTHWDIPTFSFPNKRDIFYYTTLFSNELGTSAQGANRFRTAITLCGKIFIFLFFELVLFCRIMNMEKNSIRPIIKP